MNKPICIGCDKHPEEIYEYRAGGEIEGLTAEEYCRQEEGTLNHGNGHFWCTQCYIVAGQPLGKAP